MAIPAEVVKRFNRLISAVRGSEPVQLLQMMDNKDGNPAYLIVVQEQSADNHASFELLARMLDRTDHFGLPTIYDA
jgi:hypothetical protein